MVDGFEYFQSQGWSPVQSAGIMGNLFGESSLNPRAIGDGGAAFGVAQWHPDRQQMFERVMGVNIRGSSLGQQYQFVNWELNNTEKKAGNWLRQQSTLSGATHAFMKGYERPANMSSFGSRLAAGAKALAGGEGLLGSAARALANSNPISAGVLGLTDGMGLTGECSWICQIQNWIKETGFFQRLALAFLAFIILVAAFYLMKGNSILEAAKGKVA